MRNAFIEWIRRKLYAKAIIEGGTDFSVFSVTNFWDDATYGLTRALKVVEDVQLPLCQTHAS